ncbi:hypothetical protein HY522_07790 [bacterium]|nr:hypothetical protein [bacterium]
MRQGFDEIGERISTIPPFHLLFLTTAAVFLGEGLVMLLIHKVPFMMEIVHGRPMLGEAERTEGVLSALILSAIIFPVLYIFAYLPLVRIIRDLQISRDNLKAAERDLRVEQNNAMEYLRRTAEIERMASMGRLAGGVAHEVNNALAALLGMAELIRMGRAQGDEIDVILQEGRRAGKIVRDLLTFSRPAPPERRKTSLPDLIRYVLKITASDFKIRGIDAVFHPNGETPPVHADESQIHQVFLNLLINARDAMPGGGRVDIRLFAENGGVRVEVADAGAGIDPEHLPRLFDPFFTTKERGKGTGLGLSVTSAILRAHGGSIQAANRAEGAGAVFTVRLPGTDEPGRRHADFCLPMA